MKAAKSVLFIDRDGVIVEETQVDSLEKIHFIPHVMEALREIRRKTDFLLVMVSNQDGVNTPSFPYDDFIMAHERILEVLRGEDVFFDDIFIDYSGAKGIWFHEKSMDSVPPSVVLETDSWLEITAYLTNSGIKTHRKASIERETKETRISLSVDLDGSGQGKITTGIGFFDHMLEQIVRHARLDVTSSFTGDLEVDEHHSVEDIALCLGKVISKALGDKKGISRYGYDLLCMDDVHSEVSIDFSGRPDLIFDADFTREYIGTFPVEMIRHFFKSFSNEARCNLYMNVSRGNAHHQAEALFKAFARALRMAVRRIPGSNEVVSSKGVLE